MFVLSLHGLRMRSGAVGCSRCPERRYSRDVSLRLCSARMTLRSTLKGDVLLCASSHAGASGNRASSVELIINPLIELTMRICLQPKVYLIAKSELASGIQDFLNETNLEWPTEDLWEPKGPDGLDDVPSDAEKLTETAGRCCYMSFGKKVGSKTNEAYLDNLLGRLPDGGFRDGPAHGSVLEHATFSFLVVGAGRGFSHEQVRHRAGWAYSQLSTRYCDFERDEAQEGTWDPGFVVPPLGQLSMATAQAIVKSHERALDEYKRVLCMIENDLRSNPGFMASLASHPERERSRMLRKAARGAARDVLPNGTEAIMTMTANARAIWNTIALRATKHAEAEIRSVYVQVAKIMECEMPSVFKGLQYQTLWDGSECVVLPRDKI